MQASHSGEGRSQASRSVETGRAQALAHRPHRSQAPNPAEEWRMPQLCLMPQPCLMPQLLPALTVPPVSTAMSCRLALRLSPKPGALTAHTLTPARSLFTIRVASASARGEDGSEWILWRMLGPEVRSELPARNNNNPGSWGRAVKTLNVHTPSTASTQLHVLEEDELRQQHHPKCSPTMRDAHTTNSVK